MPADTADLLTAARSLPVAARRKLIDALIGTLSSEEQTREAWISECRQRLAAFDRGETAAIPLTDVFPELAETV